MAVRELESPPALGRLYARALVTGLRGGTTLPDTELVLRDVAVDRDHLAAYDRVCGFRLRDRLPATYPHVIAFPLAVELMSAPGFPFPLPGLVHVANRVTVHRPLDATDRPGFRVRAHDLRDHPKGRQFDVTAEADVDGEVVWSSTSTYLRRGGGAAGAAAPGAGLGVDDGRGAPSAVWEVAADTGRRYAAVSGDRNPIHLHPLTARLFGFPRPIAHGMWTKARCLAALEPVLPDRFTVEVVFRKPLLLPSRVAFVHVADGARTAFSLRRAKGGAVHLDGEVRPLADR